MKGGSRWFLSRKFTKMVFTDTLYRTGRVESKTNLVAVYCWRAKPGRWNWLRVLSAPALPAPEAISSARVAEVRKTFRELSPFSLGSQIISDPHVVDKSC